MGVKTHGMTGTRIYKIWDGMRYRCNKETSHDYRNYGGRGIRVCDEWNKDFTAFYDWAMNNGYKESLQIDRINNDGNYEPNNCRWATVKEQGNNRRTCTYLTINNQTKTITEWAEEKRIDRATLYNRYSNGIEGEDLFAPVLISKPAEKQVGLEGLTWDKDKKKWRLRLRVNKILKHFGYFEDLDKAIEKRKEKAKELNLHKYLYL